MARTIQGATQDPKNYYPMVGIRQIGQYVKGKVLEIGETKKNNPVATLELIDLDGSSSKSTSKGVYTEVEVAIGDKVQFVGNLTDLREKIPQLQVGDVVTITYTHDVPSNKGHAKKIFDVQVEE